MKVLVVDDSKTMRMILSRTLKELGHDTCEAENGADALEALKRESKVSLIMVDWNMPVMNGLEMIKAVRANPGFKTLPIIMVTTETEGPNIQKAIEAGAGEYIMKPFRKESVQEKLTLVMGSGKAAPAPAPSQPLEDIVPSGILNQIISGVFDSMIQIPIEEIPGATAIPGQVIDPRPHLTSLVGISGNFRDRYVIIIHASESLACRIGSAMIGEDHLTPTIAVEDAFGELANMTAGNIKSVLNQPGLCLSMPTIIRGREYYWSLPRLRILQGAVFTVENDQLYVWFGDDRVR